MRRKTFQLVSRISNCAAVEGSQQFKTAESITLIGSCASHLSRDRGLGTNAFATTNIRKATKEFELSLSTADRFQSGQISFASPLHRLGGLFYSGLVALTMLIALQNLQLGSPYQLQKAADIRASITQFADRAMAPPSAFEKELEMSSTELLHRWDPQIAAASKRFGIPENWIRAVMRQESGGRTMLAEDKKITSPVGALGLMQVMPGTYDEMREQYNLGADPFQPEDNINAGAAYLRWLHHKYGFPAMFAAYNAGPGKLEKHLTRHVALPAETQAYVKGVTTSIKSVALNTPPAHLIRLTQPNGKSIALDVAVITGLRPALRGEYPKSVKTVVELGRHKQAVREDIQVASIAIKNAAGAL